MKKLLTIVLAAVLMMGTMESTAFAAATETVDVYVTIADETGKLAIAQEKVTVKDIDNDDALTINDALYAAHEAKYEGGAAAGYASSMGDYGLKMDKLWGIANGGSYGYYVNNKSAWSLADVVQEGDYINAFIYTDLTAWSDTYCFFNVNTVSGKAGESIELTLSAAGYDSEYNPITVPVEGATITVDGVKTSVVTNAEGKATIAIAEGGTHIISAVSETQTLVPPVCMATLEAVEKAPVDGPAEEGNSPKTGEADSINTQLLFTISLNGMMVLLIKGRKAYEK